MVTTAGLIFSLFDLAETARIDAKSSFATAYLKKCSLVSVGRVTRDGGGFCYLFHDRRLKVEASGIVDIKSFMVNDPGIHRNVMTAFSNLWNEMMDQDLLSSQFDAASFIDLTVFLAKCIKFKRGKKMKTLSSNGQTLRNLLRNAVVKFLAASLDVVVMHAQLTGDLEERQIPSRGKKRSSSSRQLAAPEHAEDGSGSKPRKGRVSIDLGTIWEMYEHAKEIGVSLPVYLRTKEKEKHGGCHSQACQMWLRKIHNMYVGRAALGFRDCAHVNLIADASRFSGRDTLISAAYSPESGLGAYVNNQFLRSGKLIGPGDFLLDDTIEMLAAQRKVERQAGYCLLQALSNQIKHLTGGRKTICSFDYAETDLELALLNMTPGHLRVVTKDGNGAIRDIFVQDKDKNTLKKVDLSMAETANILTLNMDQGTSGTALASFICGTSTHLIHFGWDPYHRCSRDMRLATGMKTIAAADARTRIKLNLCQAHLASSFLFSVNYKPYGNAGWHQAKMELVEHFLSMQDED